MDAHGTFGLPLPTPATADRSGRASAQRYRQAGFQSLMDAVPFRAVAAGDVVSGKGGAWPQHSLSTVTPKLPQVTQPPRAAASLLQAKAEAPVTSTLPNGVASGRGALMMASPMAAVSSGRGPSTSASIRALVNPAAPLLPWPTPLASWRQLACQALLAEDGVEMHIRAPEADRDAWQHAAVRLRQWLLASTGLDLLRCTINGRPLWTAQAHSLSCVEEMSDVG